jgi:Fe-S-cluster containining protein
MAKVVPVDSRLRTSWERVAHRYTAYDLVLPGVPSFICQASLCKAHCCKVFSVALGDREVDRLARSSGFAPIVFLECEDGRPITLPLAQPFLLARDRGTCRMLGPDLLCSQYEGRPDACRLYPHFVLFFEPGTERPVHSDWPAMTAAVDRFTGRSASPVRALVPLLLRHVECPGFTGPPLDRQAWRTLFRETFRLQYSEAAGRAIAGR